MLTTTEVTGKEAGSKTPTAGKDDPGLPQADLLDENRIPGIWQHDQVSGTSQDYGLDRRGRYRP